ncbi:hypothetical protein BDDG_08353 [Blastomyces dermatitidis ATCC 18188]|uniref:Uncharacterized protein n=1 Tax=Ajellomyces dermatitidis (strain ATCC 18188 / CBS 674.68) TaxID=653446 RepID=F2TQ95_AJEDA|nr:hypothetical protein BDDG_08353 [Blastomyces dermatitidis ATCC 18188]
MDMDMDMDMDKPGRVSVSTPAAAVGCFIYPAAVQLSSSSAQLRSQPANQTVSMSIRPAAV